MIVNSRVNFKRRLKRAQERNWAPRREMSLLRKVERNIVVDDNGCWLWQGAKTWDGYAVLRVKTPPGSVRRQVNKKLHRLTYAEFAGAIPDGLSLDHLCRVRNCVNPKHLEPVTTAENVRRGFASRGKNVKDAKRG